MTGQPDFLMTAIRMFSALLLVLGIFLGSFYLLRHVTRRNVTGTGEEIIKIIGRTYLGVKKSVTLIEVPGRVLVLGVTDDHISLLTQIEDPDHVKLLKNSGSMKSSTRFKNQFEHLLSKIRDGGTGKDAASI